MAVYNAHGDAFQDFDFFSPDDSDDPAFGWVVLNGERAEPTDVLRFAAQLVETAAFALDQRAKVTSAEATPDD